MIESALYRWISGSRLGRNLTFILTVLSLLSALSTYYIITQSVGPFGSDPNTVLGLAFVNLLLLLALLAVVARRVFGLWAALRRGSAGSRLQTRVVLMFSLVAIVPAIIVSIFSVIFFSQGITSWFDTKVQTALEESVLVAEAYLEEHRENLRRDAIAMANDINSESYRLISNPQVFNNFVSRQAALRSLTEAVVFQEGRVIARSSLGFSLAYQSLRPDILAQADAGEVVLLSGDADEDRVRALVKLEFFADTYLLVERFVDPKVTHHVKATEDAVTGYHSLREQITKLQWRFSLVFVVVVLLLVVVAIWYGMVFANDLVRPVGRLFHAAERVRAGDFTVRVEESDARDEIGELGRAFNKMTGQLETQRGELIEATRLLDERRRFSEAVLEGLSAGVVALDREKRVLLCNRPAVSLLGLDMKKAKNAPLATLIPELAALLEEAEKNPEELAQGNINVEQKEKQLTLHVRVSAERVEEEVRGYVVTFDDITQLVSAQRKAAWAGVARRIAHEIKNPLTPIQLSAERLKRKYYDRIDAGEDREAFSRYIDNIVRNVGSIGKMAEEFATFARMPTPVFAEEDMGELIQEAVFARKSAHANVTFEFIPPKKPVVIACDAGQMGQVLTNVLKNAAESIEERTDLAAGEGQVTVTLRKKDGRCLIAVEDNGKGLPEDLIDQLDEPYVTTKTKGTGLGLAIVKKIVQDHHGEVSIENRGKRTPGARVTISLPA